MRVALVTHDSSLRHETGRFHPERPDRIPATIAGVYESGLSVVEIEPSPARFEDLALVHDAGYIASVERFCASGGGAFDPDTVAVPASWEAALLSAGGGLAAVDALANGIADVGFVAMRPPGHHALEDQAMGFCLFNNIAITARRLTSQGNKVAIVDWDVHHGNGTQRTFYDDPNVLYVSLHEFPAYPGTGWVDETGTGEGRGTTVNFPMPRATEGAPYRWAMRWVIVPILEEFEPDWLLVSSGFDAHRADPLADILLEESDYAAMAAMLAKVMPAQRTVFFLEGGYDLAALTASTAATLRGSAGDAPDPPPVEATGTSGAWKVIRHVAAARA
jgi:acetoin utilization deacetylase AcuC-like enzyme